MQINNMTSQPNNSSNKYNPNFTSIKSIKCEGMYKKYPQFANSLVESFQKNPKAMEFCKKYDVDIVFYAVKQMRDSVQSSVHIFFDNIAKSKTRKLFDKLAGKSDDKIVVYAWGNKYSLPHSIEESTANLIEAMSPERKVANGYRGGFLDSNIKFAEEKIQKALSEKAKIVEQKAAKSAAAKAAKAQYSNDVSKLQNSINELINKGK